MGLDRFELLLRKQMQAQDWLPAMGRFLLACSGGPDSVALARAMQAIGYSIALAHVNYQLRGSDSEADALFVEELARELGAPFHLHTEDLSAYRGNVQMRARELRYAFFAGLLNRHGYCKIATAHHADDQAETILHHLMLGSGLGGLMGIRPESGAVIRPLLPFDKQYILAYLQRRHYLYRRDLSNEKSAYTRNKIRRELLPVMEAIHPGSREKLAALPAMLAEAEKLVERMSTAFLETHLQHKQLFSTLSTAALAGSELPQSILWKWLHPFGFDPRQVQAILQALGKPADQRFESGSHSVCFGKGLLYLGPKAGFQPLDAPVLLAELDGYYPCAAGILRWKKVNTFAEKRTLNRHYLAAAPESLCIRSLRKADRWPTPEGNDLIANQRLKKKGIPACLRQTWPVLLSGAGLTWIPGFGASIDELDNSAEYLQLDWEPA